jgi:4-amino-4-deoxy-L-arabinose transferase-like glycosyltransferase
MFARSSFVVLGVVLVAFALRTANYVMEPRPIDGAGLVAEQGEMARNVLEHGRWFSVNSAAVRALDTRQTREGHLIDPAAFDFTRFDAHASYTPEIHQMPGVSLVLTGLWWLSGRETYSIIQWLQILLDTSMVILIYWIAQSFGLRKGAAASAAFLYAIWPGAIVVAKRPMLDTWAGFFTVWCLAAFVLARARPHSRRWLVVLGVITGLGIYFRPFLFLLPILLAVVATPSGDWRKRLVWALVPSATALFVLAPWTIRNYAEFHRFIPTRSGLGYALYEGIGQASTDKAATTYVQKHRPDLKGRAPESDSFLLRSALNTIRSHPLRYLHLIAGRLLYLLPCLLAIVVWRRWRAGSLMLLAVAIGTIVPFIPVGGDTRFYLPAAFAYLLLLTMVGVTVVSTIRRRLPLEGSVRTLPWAERNGGVES